MTNLVATKCRQLADPRSLGGQVDRVVALMKAADEIERLEAFARMILAGTTADGLYNGRSPVELWDEHIAEETPCPKREDGVHCECWYEGNACCGCGASAILNGQAWPRCTSVETGARTAVTPAPEPKAFRCEGCGDEVTESDGAVGYHTRAEPDQRGNPIPVQCGPVRAVTPTDEPSVPDCQHDPFRTDCTVDTTPDARGTMLRCRVCTFQTYWLSAAERGRVERLQRARHDLPVLLV